MSESPDKRSEREQGGPSPIEGQLAAPPASASPVTSPPDQLNPSPPARSEFMELMDRPWVIVVLLLHVGFLGIPIYWKTRYSVSTRLWIIFASIVYTVGAIAFIWIMLRWIASMLFG